MPAPIIWAKLLPLLGLGFSGLGAAKTYKLQKAQYEMQKKIANAKRREEAERIKKKDDVANLRDWETNLNENIGVATQDLENRGLGGSRQIADDAARERIDIANQFGTAGGPRGSAVQGYEDRLGADLAAAGGSQAEISSRFSQPSTGGGHAAWGNLYNNAMSDAAGDIEDYSGERSGLMAATGATRKGDEQNYLMGRGMGLADTGEESMSQAFTTDLGTAKQSLKEQERKARAKLGRAQTGVDRGYNVGESVFVEQKNQTNPYGAIASMFNTASNIKWS